MVRLGDVRVTKLLLLLERFKSDKITISPAKVSIEGAYAISICFVLVLIFALVWTLTVLFG